METRVSETRLHSFHPSPATAIRRFEPLAERVGLGGSEPVLVALSGGADSVFLLHSLAAERPRRPLFALHVDHGLRGAESRADADFCADLCRELRVPFRSVELALDAGGGDLEGRARRERYRALCREAAGLGVSTVVTGHHADDALETLVLRWTRGSPLDGLSGPRAHLALAPRSGLNPTDRGLRVVRPLLPLRKRDILRELAERGLDWRADSSNADMRFTRNRIRHAFLPAVAAYCGEDAIEHLLDFGRAVLTLEDALAEQTAHLAWTPATSEARLARADLARLPRLLGRRALVRLLAEATGRVPGRRLLALLLADLASARVTRRVLPGGWTLVLGADELRLRPPAALEPTRQRSVIQELERGELRIVLPGEVELGDGSSIAARLHEPPRDAPIPRHPFEVDLDASDGPREVSVRFARPGDRFHPLGAPGSKRLCRFLAEVGIPREERPRVPLVFADGELVWVAGVRPCDGRRVRPSTRRRLRLVSRAAGRNC